MAVWAFDRAVLMRQAPIVAGRLHAVMCAQCLVAPRLILPCVGVEIAEGGRETVAAMLTKALSRCPKLQPAGRDVGGHAALSYATAAVDPVRYDRRWRR